MKVLARSIHQIEITSRCNLACRYCPHPKMTRPKIDMTREIFMRALHWAARLPGDSNRELNLAGTGESTLHPDFVDFVHLAREAMPDHIRLVLATNGLTMTKDLARALAPTGVRVFVSLHRPERAGPAIEILKEFGLYEGASNDPAQASVNWAGQVKWHVSTPLKGSPCPWIRNGWLIVLSDGRITRCSFDNRLDETIGTIWDDIGAMETSPYSLCKDCHLIP